MAGGALEDRRQNASMRPSDITDGIEPAAEPSPDGADRGCFNEAVGYYRRNRRCSDIPSVSESIRFNEAVGYYRRNRDEFPALRGPAIHASMRPSDITDGILDRLGDEQQRLELASMRPSDITDGIGPRPNPS